MKTFLFLLAGSVAAGAQDALELRQDAVVRSGPAETQSSLGTAHAGERYVVVSNSGTWVQIWWAGNLGWIPSASVDPAAGMGVEIRTSTVNVRSSASSTASIVGHAHLGEVYAHAGSSRSWFKIWFGGTLRWVYGGTNSAAYELGVAGDTSVDVVAGTAQVRRGPGSTYFSIGAAYAGQRFARVGSSGGWHKVMYGHDTGWISGSEGVATGVVPVRVLVFSATVRSAASASASSLGHVHAGQPYVPVTAYAGWVQIAFRDGYGWVPADSVSADSSTVRGAQGAQTVAVSDDGRFAAFTSTWQSHVWNDTNGVGDVFVVDCTTNAIERASVTMSGAQAAAKSSLRPSLSRDGRYVAFTSDAVLEGGDGNKYADVYLRDRTAGTTALVTSGANGASGSCAVSADGGAVAFASLATNLVFGDTNGTWDIYVRDYKSKGFWRASAGANAWSDWPSISADGRRVAFHSAASNLVSGDTNGTPDVFVRDAAGTIVRASVSTAGEQANQGGTAPSLSANGRFVAFASGSTNLVWGDTNGQSDVFVRDLLTGVTTRVSVGTGGTQADGQSTAPSISSDGRYVSFISAATNLVAGDTNGAYDGFVHDRWTGVTTRVSVSTAGAQGTGHSIECVISGDGRIVGLASLASNLVAGDSNNAMDLFLRRRW